MYAHLLKNNLYRRNWSQNIIGIFLFLFMMVAISGCKWFKERPEIADKLAEHFNNKLYKDFDTLEYNPVFDAELKRMRAKLGNPNTIQHFYEDKQGLPVLSTKFLFDGGIDSLLSKCDQIGEEGLNPALFDTKELKKQLAKLRAGGFQAIEEVYPVIAKIELLTANTLLNYSSDMRYGVVNPRKLFNRFFIPVARPDSAFMLRTLQTTNIAGYIDTIGPKSKAYAIMKSTLQRYRDSLHHENDPSIKTIKLNMERLRWQIPPIGDSYVWVNIPDCNLRWMEDGKEVERMKVCVGEKREADYQNKLKNYMKTGNLDDRPKNHETSVLLSHINSVNVNPVWNIPNSIAQNEIYFQAKNDPYYLANSNMKVFYKGKEVTEPDTINWAKYQRDKLPYTFKQGSGAGNALGKFKFIFQNSVGIYLHDTNNKRAFGKSNRAVSHGCIRVENPLKLAELLVGDERTYDRMRIEVDLPPVDTTRMEEYRKKLKMKADTVNVYKLRPRGYSVKNKLPLLISYYTAWVEKGQVVFAPDIYDLDSVLSAAMKKYTSK